MYPQNSVVNYNQNSKYKNTKMEVMKIKQHVIDYSLKNGLGKPSVSIYLRGCDKPIKCKGCHNYEFQSFSKEEYDLEKLFGQLDMEIERFLKIHSELYLCILGGEPLAKHNKFITYEISKYVKNKYESSKIVLYSWRTLEDIEKDRLNSYLNYIDYGVLGYYEEELHVKDTLPSSSNQYIYDFKEKTTLEPIKLRR